MPGAWRKEADSVVVAVRLTPKADRDAVDGMKQLADGRSVVAVRVRAVPEKGAANVALERVLARTLGVPGSAVRVVSGATARLKQVRIDGDAPRLEAALAELPEVT